MKRIWIAQVLSLAVAGSMGCMAEEGADELEGAADEQSPSPREMKAMEAWIEQWLRDANWLDGDTEQPG
jgi:hypothetical protein